MTMYIFGYASILDSSLSTGQNLVFKAVTFLT